VLFLASAFSGQCFFWPVLVIVLEKKRQGRNHNVLELHGKWLLVVSPALPSL